MEAKKAKPEKGYAFGSTFDKKPAEPVRAPSNEPKVAAASQDQKASTAPKQASEASKKPEPVKPAEVKPKASQEPRPTAVTNVKPAISDAKKPAVASKEESGSDNYSEYDDESG